MQEPTIAELAVHLEERIEQFQDYEFPQISVIIPAYNCTQNIAITLDAILTQNYPYLEIIVVDGESTDRTLEIVKGYHDERIHIYSLSQQEHYALLNEGISHAKGEYINFLFPGDFYLFPKTLKIMMGLVLKQGSPHFVYCGTLLRDGKSDVKTLYRNYNFETLNHGQQPSSLQSFWFRRELFSQFGKFNSSYKLRGGYDFLCRLNRDKNIRFASTSRILIDFDLRWVTRGLVLTHFWETMHIIRIYFGPLAVLRWLFYQRDIKRFGKFWWHSLRVAFTGR